jgi:putative DNA primase/helicase
MSTIDRARGRWPDILAELGIDRKHLINRHGPCPACGGRDRFRFDDKGGSGSFFCNGCGAGSGITLLMRMNGWGFKEAAQAVDSIIGAEGADERRIAPPPRPAFLGPAVPPDFAEGRKEAAGLLIEAGDPGIVTRYLQGRGMSLVPKELRGHPRLKYVHDREFFGHLPAVLAPVRCPDGELRAVLRIWTDPHLPKRKKLNGPIGQGAAVRLFEPGDVLGIAEGVETAVAAAELFDVPTWAVISVTGMRNFEPPPGVRKLWIFADHDENGAGERAANHLIERLDSRLEVEAKMPREVGDDWLDVLVSRRARKRP